MAKIKSVTTVQKNNHWCVRVRDEAGDTFLGASANYTMHQAEAYAASIRRDLAGGATLGQLAGT